ncbi:MAG: threonine/serine exporter family protein [Prevotella sp.]|nr:threonine/serine exporter family protein [Bacteroides sp.]MCM1366839.1 threonine/serine exporter family protein [Prevotella sp.]MCM1437189.1 threonine/serine exporter family protein [Prevotella sp.]
MIDRIFQDALFSAMAAIGFAAISRPPHRAYIYCALIAAIGHSFRYVMINSSMEIHIIPATFIAAFIIGLGAVFVSPLSKIPAETYLFPSLLPMIPGIYAYKTFAGLAMCMFSSGQESFNHSFFLFVSNGITCGCILLCMVIGSVIPIFMLKKISFQATR